MQTQQEDFTKVLETVGRIEQEVSRHMIAEGSHPPGGHVHAGRWKHSSEGLPGLGKTETVNTLGKVMGLGFSRIQFHPI